MILTILRILFLRLRNNPLELVLVFRWRIFSFHRTRWIRETTSGVGSRRWRTPRPLMASLTPTRSSPSLEKWAAVSVIRDKPDDHEVVGSNPA